MTENAVAFIALIISSLGGIGGLVSLLNYRANRAKLRADASVAQANAADIITGASAKLVTDLRAEITDLQSMLADARSEVAKLQATIETERMASRAEIQRLRNQVTKLGGIIQLPTRGGTNDTNG